MYFTAIVSRACEQNKTISIILVHAWPSMISHQVMKCAHLMSEHTFISCTKTEHASLSKHILSFQFEAAFHKTVLYLFKNSHSISFKPKNRGVTEVRLLTVWSAAVCAHWEGSNRVRAVEPSAAGQFDKEVTGAEHETCSHREVKTSQPAAEERWRVKGKQQVESQNLETHLHFS